MKTDCHQKPETCEHSVFCELRREDGKMERWVECQNRNSEKCPNAIGDWWENYLAGKEVKTR